MGDRKTKGETKRNRGKRSEKDITREDSRNTQCGSIKVKITLDCFHY